MTIGLELNNPGNLEYNENDKWQGLNDPPFKGKFFWFSTPVWGIRAMARVLITKQDKYGLKTVEGIIGGGAGGVGAYAPAVDHNDVQAYVRDLYARTNFPLSQALDMHSYADQRALVPAIIWHEQGSMPYTDAQIDEGLRLAGVKPPAPQTALAAVASDPVARLAAAGTALATVQGGVASAASIWDTVATRVSPVYLIAACVLALFSVLVWRVVDRLKARRDGVT